MLDPCQGCTSSSNKQGGLEWGLAENKFGHNNIENIEFEGGGFIGSFLGFTDLQGDLYRLHKKTWKRQKGNIYKGQANSIELVVEKDIGLEQIFGMEGKEFSWFFLELKIFNEWFRRLDVKVLGPQSWL